MNGYTAYARQLRDHPQTAAIYDRLHAYGAQAHAIADIPAGFFDGIDIRLLNGSGVPGLGGPDRSALTVSRRAALVEVFGHADPALSVALPEQDWSLAVLLRLASDRQRSTVFGWLAADTPVWGAFAITEPASGSDATHLATCATKVSGGYLLNGEKCYIGNASRARFVVVFATVDPRRGQFGLRAFLVALPAQGVGIDDRNRMLGMRAVRVSHIALRDCFVPDSLLLGHDTGIDLARSFAYAQMSFDAMRPCLAALAVGATQRVLDDLIERLPRAGAPALRDGAAALADRYCARLASARLLCRRAAALYDAGERSSAAASVAKLHAADLAREVIEAVMLLPGIADHPSSADFLRWYRDFQAFHIMEGTGDMQRLMIARNLIARPPLAAACEQALPC